MLEYGLMKYSYALFLILNVYPIKKKKCLSKPEKYSN